MKEVNTDCSFNQENLSPFRGPSGNQARSQYYEVLNHFFTSGARVRRFARFKRAGDKQGWGAPEFREGLELDRKFFFDLDPALTQARARIHELALDGCEFVSFKKHPAPGGMVSYLLVSWPTNSELERNRAKRTSEGHPKQAPPPRELTPYRRPQPYHTAESDDRPTTTRQERVAWFEKNFGATRSSTTPTTHTIDLPLFDGGKP